jgi:hypothetical protein
MTADDPRAGPPTGHADLDTLADLHAGALDQAEAARVRAHVDGCAQCSAALAALDSVQAQLRALPAPPVPAAVAARLDATLADLRTEQPARPAAPAAGTERDPEDELALARARRGRRLSRAIGAVAAAVVVVAAGGAVAAIVRTATTSTSSNDSAASGAGGAASAPVAPQSADSPRATGLDSNGSEAAVPAYDRSSLRDALPRIAAQGTDVVATAMADPARRTACAGSIPGAAGALSGLERIVYRGQPAYVFVYDDAGRLTGYVVTDGCGTAPGLPAAVLDTVS